MTVMSLGALQSVKRARVPLLLLLLLGGCQLIGGITERRIVGSADAGAAGEPAGAAGSSDAGTTGEPTGGQPMLGGAGGDAGSPDILAGAGGEPPEALTHQYSRLYGDEQDQVVVDVGRDSESTPSRVYGVGYFRGKASFGDSVPELEADDTNGDLFLVGFDAMGIGRFARVIDADPAPDTVAVSGELTDSIVVAGSFTGTVSAGSGFDVATFDTEDIFLMTFNLDGTPTLAKSYGDAGIQRALDAASDGTSLFLVGSFEMGLDLGGTTIPVTAEYGNYVAKLDAQGTGIWLRTFPDCGTLFLTAVAGTLDGGAVAVGNYNGVCQIDSEPLPDPTYGACVAIKLNELGNVAWVESLGETRCTATEVAFNQDGVALVGTLEGPSGVDPNQVAEDREIFVARYNSLGDFRWIRLLQREGPDWGTSVDFAFNRVSLTGTTSSGMLAAQFDVNGEWLWTRDSGTVGGSFGPSGPFVAAWSNGVYVVGNLLEPADLGGGLLTPAGSAESDVFVAIYQ